MRGLVKGIITNNFKVVHTYYAKGLVTENHCVFWCLTFFVKDFIALVTSTKRMASTNGLTAATADFMGKS